MFHLYIPAALVPLLSEGIDMECKRNHYYLNIYYLYEGDNIELLLSDWQRAGVKGIVLLSTEMIETDIRSFLKSSIPMVLLDNYLEIPGLNSVLINNIQDAYTAIDYLIHKYRTQPGYLHSAYSINNFEERADGFYKAIRALKEADYRIPQDIAVIGFDDMPLCTYIEPTLTTICVPKQYMGKVAIRRIHELISESDTTPLKIEIATSLVKRKSV